LDEISVTGAKDRERRRGPAVDIDPVYRIVVTRDGIARIQLALQPRNPGELPWQISFRRESSARRLTPESAPPMNPASAAQLSRDPLRAVGNSLRTVYFALEANVDEADGLPASIPFGPHASLVNLDYVRVLAGDAEDRTGITVLNAIYPQTRRCEDRFALLDE